MCVENYNVNTHAHTHTQMHMWSSDTDHTDTLLFERGLSEKNMFYLKTKNIENLEMHAHPYTLSQRSNDPGMFRLCCWLQYEREIHRFFDPGFN